MSTFAKPSPKPTSTGSSIRRHAKTPVVSNHLFGERFTVSPPHSPDEQEAQFVAREAVAPNRSDVSPRLPELTAKPTAPRTVPTGRRLDPSVKIWANQRLGDDFDDVRIHTGGRADELTRSFGARAATLGNHIFFRANEYHPNHFEGKRTLAHELWHTRQPSTGDHRLRLERAADFNELTLLDPRFSYFFDHALDGSYIHECMVRALGLDAVIDLHHAAATARDQQAPGVAFARLDALADLALRVSEEFDDLAEECSLVQGPPSPAKPKPDDTPQPKRRKGLIESVQQHYPPEFHMGPAPRPAPAPEPPQPPQSHVSDHHRIVYKHVREGKIPPFESIHRIVMYERAGISWGFADDLIEIARESDAAKLAAFYVLQGLSDSGYHSEYEYKIERFIEEGLMTHEEIDAEAANAPYWYTPEVQQGIVHSLGGQQYGPPELDLKGLEGSGTVELGSFSKAGFKITISGSTKWSVTDLQMEDGISISAARGPDSGSVGLEYEEDGKSGGGSYQFGSQGHAGEAAYKFKPEEVFEDPGQIAKVISEVSIGVDKRGLPTLSLASGNLGRITTSYDFSTTGVTGKFTWPLEKTVVEYEGKKLEVKGSITLIVSIEPDPDAFKLEPEHWDADPQDAVETTAGVVTAFGIVVLVAALIAAPPTSGASLALPALAGSGAGLGLFVVTEDD